MWRADFAEWDFWNCLSQDSRLPQTARKRQTSCPGIVTLGGFETTGVNFWVLSPTHDSNLRKILTRFRARRQF
jgi:hypothetical protein